MKKLIFLTVFSYAIIAEAQIKMNSSGKVGIGSTAPTSYSLSTGSISASGSVKFSNNILFDNTYYGSDIEINMGFDPSVGYFKQLVPTQNNGAQIGSSGKAFFKMYSYSFEEISDRRYKENIKKLSNSLAVIQSLDGVRYDFKMDLFKNSNSKDSEKNKIGQDRKNKLGFIAQDVYKVLPEVVSHDDSTDIYSVNYTSIIPLLVEGIKEQQEMIENLQSELDGLKKKAKPTSSRFIDSTASAEENIETAQQLYQNQPNPADGHTEIRYALPQEPQTASIGVYDMQGTQLKSYAITGSGSVTIKKGELPPGMYLYSLIADGQLVDTKKMVLTE